MHGLLLNSRYRSLCASCSGSTRTKVRRSTPVSSGFLEQRSSATTLGVESPAVERTVLSIDLGLAYNVAIPQERASEELRLFVSRKMHLEPNVMAGSYALRKSACN